MAPASRADGALRIESWAGEVRVNLVRLAALLAFFSHHLYRVWQHRDDPGMTPAYLQAVTALVIAWGCMIVVLHVGLSRRWMPHWLPFVTAVADVALITMLLIVSGGVQSPLVVLYWLAIASTPLRLSLPVVYVTTIAAMLGYLVALGHYVFIRIGSATYYADAALRVPRTNQVIALLALAVAGLFAGQVVRQSRRLAAGYPVSAASTED